MPQTPDRTVRLPRRLRVLALATSVVAVAQLPVAQATDLAPLRVIKDQDPIFNTLWVDLVID